MINNRNIGSKNIRNVFSSAALLLLAACASPSTTPDISTISPSTPAAEDKGYYKVGSPYWIKGKMYIPKEEWNYEETGLASWYGPGFHGGKTANGERFNKQDVTAAHPTLPLPSMVRITNLDNGRVLDVKVNDRGPFHSNRILDVSKQAAILLGFEKAGTAKVRIKLLPQQSYAMAKAAGRKDEGTNPILMANTADYNVDEQANKLENSIAETAPSSTTTQGKNLTQKQMASANPDEVYLSNNTPAAPLNNKSPNKNTLKQNTLKQNTGHQHYVQAGAFSMEKNAKALSQQLKSVGPVLLYPSEYGGSTMWRVWIGPFNTQQEAQQVKLAAKGHGVADAVIVTR
ncbi:MAG: septal ring lytic transglycosylase RlpA family protein [Alphaproteobacteria bacterium]